MSRAFQVAELVASALPTAASRSMASAVDLAVYAERQKHVALTAASSPLTEVPHRDAKDFLTPEALRVRIDTWQKEVLEYAEQIPEIAGVSSIIENSASRMKLVVGDLEGYVAPSEGGERAQAASARLRETTRAELQRRVDVFDLGRATKLIFLTGDNYILWPQTGDPEALSVAEVDLSNKPWKARGAGGSFADIGPTSQLMRVWRKSSSNRFQSTSAFKASLELLKAMYLHQLADTAVATSRLAGAGILFWPTTRVAQGRDEDGNFYPGSQEELLKQFADASIKSITKRDSRDAVIPMTFFYDPEGMDAKHGPELLRIDREDQASQYAERFREYAHRLAVAIDLPLESTEGMGSTNHWSAWQIDVDKTRTYVTPLVELTVNAFNERVAHPLGLHISIDATELTKKPDQTETIMQLAALKMVTPESVLAALISGKLEDLVHQEAPELDYESNVRPTEPSDFKVGGDRGGGKFRDQT